MPATQQKPEPTLFKLLDIAKNRLDEVKTIVEIGARDCTETVAFSTEMPQAHVYSFECNPATLPLCRKRVKGRKNITLTEKAVSDKNGTVTFHPIDQEKTTTTWKDGNPGASSMLMASGKYPAEQYVQKTIKVGSTTLRSFMKTNSIDTIDILWMDIQGAELMALKGAGKRIKDIRLIQTEVEFMEIYEGQPQFKDIKRFLNTAGFLLIGFNSFDTFTADAVFLNASELSASQKIASQIQDKTLYRRHKHKLV